MSNTIASDPVLDSIDHALHDWQVSGDAMRWTPEPVRQSPTQLTPQQIAALTRVMATAGATVARAMKALTKTFEHAGKTYLRFAHRITEHDRIRCRVCRPYANPRPLRLGAEYHRRQKRRTRR